MDLMTEYQRYHGTVASKAKRKVMKWSCPPRGRLKLNVDGSFKLEENKGGVGVVLRDANGDCKAALPRPLPRIGSAFAAEVEALRAGLLLAIHMQCTAVEVETDCIALVNALHRDEEDLSDIGRIVEDYKRYVSSFVFFQCRHVNREANGVANKLAHLASSSYLDEVWLEEIPNIILDVLYEDIHDIIRDGGSMSPY